MATKIVTKNSSTAGAAPTATDLVQGELAVNVADGRLYTEDNAAAIVELGVNPATEITANAGIALPDSQKATFGASDDLQIYHSGTGSYITDSGTGALYIQGQNLLLQNNDGSKVYFSGIGDVSTLYYGTGTKLATTSTGIDVTGTASATSVTSAQHLTAGSAYSLLFGDGGERISGNNSSSLLNFFTGATERMRIDSSGNVGIGTTSPDEALEVNGDIKSSGGNFGIYHFGETSDVTKIVGRDASHGSFPNTMDFFTNSAQRMRIDSSGNVGIGTSSPTAPLQVNGSVNGIHEVSITNTFDDNDGTGDNPSARLYLSAASNNGYIECHGAPANGASNHKIDIGSTAGSSFLTFSPSGAERMRIDSSGNVGIGTSSPAVPLHVNGGTANQIGLIESTDATVKLGFKDNSTTNNYSVTIGAVGNAMTFTSGGGGSERMRIDSSGNLLVGTTTTDRAASAGITLNGAGFIDISRSGTIAGRFTRLGSDGSVIDFRREGTNVGSISVTASATAYNTSSDQRLKENIADADDAGSKIDAIQVRQYDWKADGSHQDYGVVAQELVEIAPEAVTVPADSEAMMGVDYSKLVPMLIKEIQSLRNRVAQLETGE